jgi:8-oxo-dGTP diphosphatase
MAGKTILAAGGIVVRRGARPLIAVVQRSKDGSWVLPRGKLKRKERAVMAARREVVEETGHDVRVRGYLGAIAYQTRGQRKLVQFWHMQARARPSRKVMKDIAQVKWLPLPRAIRRLSYPLEKLILQNAGRRAVRKSGARKTSKKSSSRRTRRRK